MTDSKPSEGAGRGNGAGVQEGSARIMPGAGKGAQDVFYNPPQVFNRDFSVLVLNVYARLRDHEERERRERRIANNKSNEKLAEYTGLRVLEGLSASGLRSVRYWKEVSPPIAGITVNDFDATAVEHIRENMKHNGVPTEGAEGERKATPNHADVNLHLYNNCNVYDVVDLDPYGTVSPFLDSAIKGVKNGGLLCITSTDMPILGGNHPETCFYRYGGTALKAKYIHEMSLRILMNAVVSTAARHQRSVECLMACSIDFYVRVFVRVYDKPVKAKELALKTGLVFQCCQCEAFHIQPLGDADYTEAKQPANGGNANGANGATASASASSSASSSSAAPAAAEPAKKEFSYKGMTIKRFRVAKKKEEIGSNCEECGGRFSIGGPLYLGSLYNKEFIAECLAVCEANVGDGTAENKGGEVKAEAEKTEQEKLLALPYVASWKKIQGMLTAMDEEIEDIPLHYSLPELCGGLKLNTVPLKQFKGALRSLGYRASHFHREPTAVKTDAPNRVVYDLVRKWATITGKKRSREEMNGAAPAEVESPGSMSVTPEKPAEVATGEKDSTNSNSKPAKPAKHPKSRKNNVLSSFQQAIMDREITSEGVVDKNFDFKNFEEKDEERPKKIARFMPNPEKFWGPGKKAKPVTPAEAGTIGDKQ